MDDQAPRPVAYWRVILAAILDFLTAFFVLGYLVATMTGGTTETGFQLNGAPAFVLFGLIVAYFFVGNRLGGTLWRRVLHVPPKPRA
jgi:hypothetical protein